MSCQRLGVLIFVCFISAGCSFLEVKPDPSRYFALTSLPRTGQTAQDAAKKTVHKESYLTQPAKDKSTEASVASMSELVSDLSKEIAAAIRALTVG